MLMLTILPMILMKSLRYEPTHLDVDIFLIFRQDAGENQSDSSLDERDTNTD